MKINLFVLLSFLLFYFCVNAQSSVNCNGINVTSTAGSMSYTVGQTDFTFYESTVAKANLGVQQPAEIFSVKETVSLTCIVFPNPVAAEMYLSSDDPDYQLFSYKLFDMQGRLLQQESDVKIDKSIFLEALATGTYVLYVSNAKKDELTCKFIKITP
ncbi:MAG: T9SS type A sorting domain-containing protein [Saprospiraceae bacterium]